MTKILICSYKRIIWEFKTSKGFYKYLIGKRRVMPMNIA